MHNEYFCTHLQSSSANFYIGDSDVKADYESHLHNATTDSRVVLGASLQSLTAATGGAVPPLTAVPYASPLLANGSILVYNPLGWARTHAVRVVVPQGTVAATVIDGETGAQVGACTCFCICVREYTWVHALGGLSVCICITFSFSRF